MLRHRLSRTGRAVHADFAGKEENDKMKLIAAADEKWGIGKDGGLLCHLPGDLKYFKEKTLGKTLIMGRKTLESLPGGKPLPGRGTVVLTRDSKFSKESCSTAASVEELLSMYGGRSGAAADDQLMAAGGGEVYRQLLKYCDSAHNEDRWGF